MLVAKSADPNLMFVLLKTIISTGKVDRGERGNITFIFLVPINLSCKIEMIVSTVLNTLIPSRDEVLDSSS